MTWISQRSTDWFTQPRAKNYWSRGDCSIINLKDFCADESINMTKYQAADFMDSSVETVSKSKLWYSSQETFLVNYSQLIEWRFEEKTTAFGREENAVLQPYSPDLVSSEISSFLNLKKCFEKTIWFHRYNHFSNKRSFEVLDKG